MIRFILILSLLYFFFFKVKESFTEPDKLIPNVINKVYIVDGNQDIPSNIKKAIKTWTDLNPGYTLKYWYLGDCLEYLKQNFSDEHVECFNGFIHI